MTLMRRMTLTKDRMTINLSMGAVGARGVAQPLRKLLLLSTVYVLLTRPHLQLELIVSGTRINYHIKLVSR